MPYIVVTKSQKVKKRKKVVKIASFVLILLLILSILIVLNTYWKSTLPTLLDITQAKISAQTVLVINQAVTTSFQDTDVFGDLISIQRDNDGNIILLTANSLQANKLARQTAIVSQQRLDQLAKEQIEVPFGTISGIPLFSEMGPEITITVTPIGAVNCTFTSTFESVGINQTLHRMFIQVECKMDLIIPQMHHTMECVVPILVSESIIIGKVPQTYLNGGLVVGGGNSV
ncbi:MAG: sporulation protein YunB [Clostridia bacterium]|nr:sporulation protein YunB [Clostridia bacterium]MBQ4272461.1 sporulation protein YunB [Clostridia bacterium]